MKNIAFIIFATTLFTAICYYVTIAGETTPVAVEEQQPTVVYGPNGTIRDNQPNEWKMPQGEVFVNEFTTNNAVYMITRVIVDDSYKIYRVDENEGTMTCTDIIRNGQ